MPCVPRTVWCSASHPAHEQTCTQTRTRTLIPTLNPISSHPNPNPLTASRRRLLYGAHRGACRRALHRHRGRGRGGRGHGGRMVKLMVMCREGTLPCTVALVVPHVPPYLLLTYLLPVLVMVQCQSRIIRENEEYLHFMYERILSGTAERLDARHELTCDAEEEGDRQRVSSDTPHTTHGDTVVHPSGPSGEPAGRGKTCKNASQLVGRKPYDDSRRPPQGL